MRKYKNDIAFTQRREQLKAELEDVENKIKVVPSIKKMISDYHNNVKVSLDKSGDTQQLNIEFKIIETDDAWFGGDELEEIYDFGWHVYQVSYNKNTITLVLQRNAYGDEED